MIEVSWTQHTTSDHPVDNLIVIIKACSSSPCEIQDPQMIKADEQEYPITRNVSVFLFRDADSSKIHVVIVCAVNAMVKNCSSPRQLERDPIIASGVPIAPSIDSLFRRDSVISTSWTQEITDERPIDNLIIIIKACPSSPCVILNPYFPQNDDQVYPVSRDLSIYKLTGANSDQAYVVAVCATNAIGRNCSTTVLLESDSITAFEIPFAPSIRDVIRRDAVIEISWAQEITDDHPVHNFIIIIKMCPSYQCEIRDTQITQDDEQEYQVSRNESVFLLTDADSSQVHVVVLCAVNAMVRNCSEQRLLERVPIKQPDVPLAPTIDSLFRSDSRISISWKQEITDDRPINKFIVIIKECTSSPCMILDPYFPQEDEQVYPVNIDSSYYLITGTDSRQAHDVIVCGVNAQGRNCSAPVLLEKDSLSAFEIPFAPNIGVVSRIESVIETSWMQEITIDHPVDNFIFIIMACPTSVCEIGDPHTPYNNGQEYSVSHNASVFVYTGAVSSQVHVVVVCAVNAMVRNCSAPILLERDPPASATNVPFAPSINSLFRRDSMISTSWTQQITYGRPIDNFIVVVRACPSTACVILDPYFPKEDEHVYPVSRDLSIYVISDADSRQTHVVIVCGVNARGRNCSAPMLLERDSISAFEIPFAPSIGVVSRIESVIETSWMQEITVDHPVDNFIFIIMACPTSACEIGDPHTPYNNGQEYSVSRNASAFVLSGAVSSLVHVVLVCAVNAMVRNCSAPILLERDPPVSATNLPFAPSINSLFRRDSVIFTSWMQQITNGRPIDNFIVVVKACPSTQCFILDPYFPKEDEQVYPVSRDLSVYLISNADLRQTHVVVICGVNAQGRNCSAPILLDRVSISAFEVPFAPSIRVVSRIESVIETSWMQEITVDHPIDSFIFIIMACPTSVCEIGDPHTPYNNGQEYSVSSNASVFVYTGAVSSQMHVVVVCAVNAMVRNCSTPILLERDPPASATNVPFAPSINSLFRRDSVISTSWTQQITEGRPIDNFIVIVRACPSTACVILDPYFPKEDEQVYPVSRDLSVYVISDADSRQAHVVVVCGINARGRNCSAPVLLERDSISAFEIPFAPSIGVVSRIESVIETSWMQEITVDHPVDNFIFIIMACSSSACEIGDPHTPYNNGQEYSVSHNASAFVFSGAVSSLVHVVVVCAVNAMVRNCSAPILLKRDPPASATNVPFAPTVNSLFRRDSVIFTSWMQQITDGHPIDNFIVVVRACPSTLCLILDPYFPKEDEQVYPVSRDLSIYVISDADSRETHVVVVCGINARGRNCSAPVLLERDSISAFEIPFAPSIGVVSRIESVIETSWMQMITVDHPVDNFIFIIMACPTSACEIGDPHTPYNNGQEYSVSHNASVFVYTGAVSSQVHVVVVCAVNAMVRNCSAPIFLERDPPALATNVPFAPSINSLFRRDSVISTSWMQQITEGRPIDNFIVVVRACPSTACVILDPYFLKEDEQVYPVNRDLTIYLISDADSRQVHVVIVCGINARGRNCSAPVLLKRDSISAFEIPFAPSIGVVSRIESVIEISWMQEITVDHPVDNFIFIIMACPTSTCEIRDPHTPYSNGQEYSVSHNASVFVYTGAVSSQLHVVVVCAVNAMVRNCSAPILLERDPPASATNVPFAPSINSLFRRDSMISTSWMKQITEGRPIDNFIVVVRACPSNQCVILDPYFPKEDEQVYPVSRDLAVYVISDADSRQAHVVVVCGVNARGRNCSAPVLLERDSISAFEVPLAPSIRVVSRIESVIETSWMQEITVDHPVDNFIFIIMACPTFVCKIGDPHTPYNNGQEYSVSRNASIFVYTGAVSSQMHVVVVCAVNAMVRNCSTPILLERDPPASATNVPFAPSINSLFRRDSVISTSWTQQINEGRPIDNFIVIVRACPSTTCVILDPYFTKEDEQVYPVSRDLSVYVISDADSRQAHVVVVCGVNARGRNCSAPILLERDSISAFEIPFAPSIGVVSRIESVIEISWMHEITVDHPVDNFIFIIMACSTSTCEIRDPHTPYSSGQEYSVSHNASVFVYTGAVSSQVHVVVVCAVNAMVRNCSVPILLERDPPASASNVPFAPSINSLFRRDSMISTSWMQQITEGRPIDNFIVIVRACPSTPCVILDPYFPKEDEQVYPVSRDLSVYLISDADSRQVHVVIVCGVNARGRNCSAPILLERDSISAFEIPFAPSIGVVSRIESVIEISWMQEITVDHPVDNFIFIIMACPTSMCEIRDPHTPYSNGQEYSVSHNASLFVYTGAVSSQVHVAVVCAVNAMVRNCSAPILLERDPPASATNVPFAPSIDSLFRRDSMISTSWMQQITEGRPIDNFIVVVRACPSNQCVILDPYFPKEDEQVYPVSKDLSVYLISDADSRQSHVVIVCGVNTRGRNCSASVLLVRNSISAFEIPFAPSIRVVSRNESVIETSWIQEINVDHPVDNFIVIIMACPTSACEIRDPHTPYSNAQENSVSHNSSVFVYTGAVSSQVHVVVVCAVNAMVRNCSTPILLERVPFAPSIDSLFRRDSVISTSWRQQITDGRSIDNFNVIVRACPSTPCVILDPYFPKEDEQVYPVSKDLSVYLISDADSRQTHVVIVCGVNAQGRNCSAPVLLERDSISAFEIPFAPSIGVVSRIKSVIETSWMQEITVDHPVDNFIFIIMACPTSACEIRDPHTPYSNGQEYSVSRNASVFVYTGAVSSLVHVVVVCAVNAMVRNCSAPILLERDPPASATDVPFAPSIDSLFRRDSVISTSWMQQITDGRPIDNFIVIVRACLSTPCVILDPNFPQQDEQVYPVSKDLSVYLISNADSRQTHVVILCGVNAQGRNCSAPVLLERDSISAFEIPFAPSIGVVSRIESVIEISWMQEITVDHPVDNFIFIIMACPISACEIRDPHTPYSNDQEYSVSRNASVFVYTGAVSSQVHVVVVCAVNAMVRNCSTPIFLERDPPASATNVPFAPSINSLFRTDSMISTSWMQQITDGHPIDNFIVIVRACPSTPCLILDPYIPQLDEQVYPVSKDLSVYLISDADSRQIYVVIVCGVNAQGKNCSAPVLLDRDSISAFEIPFAPSIGVVSRNESVIETSWMQEITIDHPVDNFIFIIMACPTSACEISDPHTPYSNGQEYSVRNNASVFVLSGAVSSLVHVVVLCAVNAMVRNCSAPILLERDPPASATNVPFAPSIDSLFRRHSVISTSWMQQITIGRPIDNFIVVVRSCPSTLCLIIDPYFPQQDEQVYPVSKDLSVYLISDADSRQTHVVIVCGVNARGRNCSASMLLVRNSISAFEIPFAPSIRVISRNESVIETSWMQEITVDHPVDNFIVIILACPSSACEIGDPHTPYSNGREYSVSRNASVFVFSGAVSSLVHVVVVCAVNAMVRNCSAPILLERVPFAPSIDSLFRRDSVISTSWTLQITDGHPIDNFIVIVRTCPSTPCVILDPYFPKQDEQVYPVSRDLSVYLISDPYSRQAHVVVVCGVNARGRNCSAPVLLERDSISAFEIPFAPSIGVVSRRESVIETSWMQEINFDHPVDNFIVIIMACPTSECEIGDPHTPYSNGQEYSVSRNASAFVLSGAVSSLVHVVVVCAVNAMVRNCSTPILLERDPPASATDVPFAPSIDSLFRRDSVIFTSWTQQITDGRPIDNFIVIVRSCPSTRCMILDPYFPQQDEQVYPVSKDLSVYLISNADSRQTHVVIVCGVNAQGRNCSAPVLLERDSISAFEIPFAPSIGVVSRIESVIETSWMQEITIDHPVDNFIFIIMACPTSACEIRDPHTPYSNDQEYSVSRNASVFEYTGAVSSQVHVVVVCAVNAMVRNCSVPILLERDPPASATNVPFAPSINSLFRTDSVISTSWMQQITEGRPIDNFIVIVRACPSTPCVILDPYFPKEDEQVYSVSRDLSIYLISDAYSRKSHVVVVCGVNARGRNCSASVLLERDSISAFEIPFAPSIGVVSRRESVIETSWMQEITVEHPVDSFIVIIMACPTSACEIGDPHTPYSNGQEYSVRNNASVFVLSGAVCSLVHVVVVCAVNAMVRNCSAPILLERDPPASATDVPFAPSIDSLFRRDSVISTSWMQQITDGRPIDNFIVIVRSCPSTLCLILDPYFPQLDEQVYPVSKDLSVYLISNADSRPTHVVIVCGVNAQGKNCSAPVLLDRDSISAFEVPFAPSIRVISRNESVIETSWMQKITVDHPVDNFIVIILACPSSACEIGDPHTPYSNSREYSVRNNASVFVFSGAVSSLVHVVVVCAVNAMVRNCSAPILLERVPFAPSIDSLFRRDSIISTSWSQQITDGHPIDNFIVIVRTCPSTPCIILDPYFPQQDEQVYPVSRDLSVYLISDAYSRQAHVVVVCGVNARGRNCSAPVLLERDSISAFEIPFAPSIGVVSRRESVIETSWMQEITFDHPVDNFIVIIMACPNSECEIGDPHTPYSNGQEYSVSRNASAFVLSGAVSSLVHVVVVCAVNAMVRNCSTPILLERDPPASATDVPFAPSIDSLFRRDSIISSSWTQQITDGRPIDNFIVIVRACPSTRCMILDPYFPQLDEQVYPVSKDLSVYLISDADSRPTHVLIVCGVNAQGRNCSAPVLLERDSISAFEIPFAPSIGVVSRIESVIETSWMQEITVEHPVDNFIVIIMACPTSACEIRDPHTPYNNGQEYSVSHNASVFVHTGAVSSQVHVVVVCAVNAMVRNCSAPILLEKDPITAIDVPLAPSILSVKWNDSLIETSWSPKITEGHPIDNFFVIIKACPSKACMIKDPYILKEDEKEYLVNNNSEVYILTSADSSKFYVIVVCAINILGRNCSSPEILSKDPPTVFAAGSAQDDLITTDPTFNQSSTLIIWIAMMCILIFLFFLFIILLIFICCRLNRFRSYWPGILIIICYNNCVLCGHVVVN